MRELERRVLLTVLDRKWREHLYEMDYLREGIGLRAYSQRDPLVEYQREGFELFSAMMDVDQGGVRRLPLQRRGPDRAADGPRGGGAAERGRSSGGRADRSVRRRRSRPRRRSPSGPASRRTRWPLTDQAPEPVAAVADHRPHIRAKGIDAPKQPKNLSYSAPTLDGDAGTEVHQASEEDIYAGASRNKPCPCGSGKKYKVCHGDPARRNA